MMAASLALVAAVAGIAWIRTGHDPLMLSARGLIAIRAAIILSARLAHEACIEFRDRFPATLERVKREVAA